MTEIETRHILAKIANELQGAQLHLIAIQDTLATLESAGMYPAVPRLAWEQKNGQGEYLYLYFKVKPYNRGHEGPDGKRKVYIGIDPAKQADALRQVENRRRWETLKEAERRLMGQIARAERDIGHVLQVFLQWSKVELGNLGPADPAAVAGLVPNSDKQ